MTSEEDVFESAKTGKAMFEEMVSCGAPESLDFYEADGSFTTRRVNDLGRAEIVEYFARMDREILRRKEAA